MQTTAQTVLTWPNETTLMGLNTSEARETGEEEEGDGGGGKSTKDASFEEFSPCHHLTPSHCPTANTHDMETAWSSKCAVMNLQPTFVLG